MLERIYRSLYRIRRIEEECVRVYPTDKIKSPMHLSIGQEGVAAGVCEALRQQDVIFGTYRSHAAYLAKGGDLKQMIAELYGKSTGCAKGKGGSMHLIDAAHGAMGASAVVGTTIANAVGYAYANKFHKKDSIVVSFFGDGATEEGVFHESLNFAALKSLPMIFICENNGYAIYTHQSRRQKNSNICERVKAYGIPAELIADDVLKVNERVALAVQEIAQQKSGPFFFECQTYRWKEHVGPNEDFNLGYRTKEDAEPWLKNDQVSRVGGMLEEKKRKQIEESVEAEIKAAFEYADTSPFPDPKELYSEVFKANEE